MYYFVFRKNVEKLNSHVNVADKNIEILETKKQTILKSMIEAINE